MIHSFETERYSLAGLLRFPEIFADVEGFVTENDFVSRLNRTIYGVIRGFLIKSEDASSLRVSEKIKNLGIQFEELDGNDIYDYLEELKIAQVNEHSSLGFFKDLKKVTVRREIAMAADNIKKCMLSSSDDSIENIVSMADKLYSEKINLFERSGNKEFSNIYDSMEAQIEERGNNPIEEFGFMGPFERVNALYGSLLRPGNITLIGSRTGVGKTSLGFAYLTWVSEHYGGIPVLHLDAGEMSETELQTRAACMFTNGTVPFHHIETGKWRKSAEMTQAMRGIWPRVKKLKMYYRNIGGLTPDEVLSVVRRFYLTYVGRGNPFLIHYDYLKPFDTDNVNTPEHQAMGHFVGKVKTLITTEIPTSLWTSLQLNRFGITTGKTASQIDDSENTFSISDRITQQISHGFLFRRKILEEMAMERNLGNAKMFCIKHRHLGIDYQAALNPVRMRDGSLRSNFIHMETSSFNFRECGDLSTTFDRIGQLGLPEDNTGSSDDDLSLQ